MSRPKNFRKAGIELYEIFIEDGKLRKYDLVEKMGWSRPRAHYYKTHGIPFKEIIKMRKVLKVPWDLFWQNLGVIYDKDDKVKYAHRSLAE